MGRRILASLLSMALIFALPVFSFADGVEIVYKDSGSPMVSMMSMRTMAANDGISMAAAEGNSGQYGYNIKPVDYDYSVSFSAYNSFNRIQFTYLNLPAGQYSFSASFAHSLRSTGVYNLDSSAYISNQGSTDGTYVTWIFTLTEPASIRLDASFNIDVVPTTSDIDYSDLTGTVLVPVDGVSCGWSVFESFSETNRRDAAEDFVWSFGNQPAGNYILNIYHYGVAYTCDWHICYGSTFIDDNNRFIPVSNTNGVSTAIVSHAGGELTLSGEVIFAHPYGDGFFDGSGNYSEYSGSGSFSIDIFQRDNWSYAVSDVIIVPLSSAGLEQFGVFGSVVGVIRDGFSSVRNTIISSLSDFYLFLIHQFSALSADIYSYFSYLQDYLTTEFTNLKSTITTQFTQLKTLITNQFTRLIDFLNEQYSGAVSSELKQGMNSANDMINQENQFTDSINTQITQQGSKVDPSSVLDGIQGSNDVFASMLWVSSIVSSGIDGMGVFQFLIYVPMILGIVTLVIGRGASLVARRPRPQPVNVRKGK